MAPHDLEMATHDLIKPAAPRTDAAVATAHRGGGAAVDPDAPRGGAPSNAEPATALRDTARALVADCKGILAADESTRTMTKRLEGVGVSSNHGSRRAFRELLVTAPGAEQYISGVILYDETIRQQTSTGVPFPTAIAQAGMLPGIKVDTGAKPLAGAPGEAVTEGLDGLRERLAEYRELGARFAKWRAVLKIGHGQPSELCLHVNAHALARYAALCQEAGLVPIVEPEVLMDGDHTQERCLQATEATLERVFAELRAHHVDLEGMLLKPNMVLAGADCRDQATIDEVADATLACLRRTVPAAVPGIVFLSGGQSDDLAIAHLRALCARGPAPWALSFSYGRALQAAALAVWAGEAANAEAAQAAFLERARGCRAARLCMYTTASLALMWPLEELTVADLTQ